MRLAAVLLFLVFGVRLALTKPKDNRSKEQPTLTAYFVDVEGGQATLIITPEGQSILIDAGWAGNDSRDADRIAAAAKLAKLKRIDIFILTHYHADHMGGVRELAEKIPIGAFIDHGPDREPTTESQKPLLENYATAASAAGLHLVAKPGDVLPIKGVDVTVVSSDGRVLHTPLRSGGNVNTFCDSTPNKEPDASEDARSLGTFWHFGRFRMLDLGDLTWNKEKELVCPVDPLGKVDVFVVSHHGLATSNSPALVHDISPRVAIEDNGAGKGGSAATYNVLKTGSGLEDIWQLHFSEDGGKDHNALDSNIANRGDEDGGYYLKLVAHADGSFAIYNSRNKYSQVYESKYSIGSYKWETR
jgi:beta-lactamase superfamily II metal-dependent hydrolase